MPCDGMQCSGCVPGQPASEVAATCRAPPASEPVAPLRILDTGFKARTVGYRCQEAQKRLSRGRRAPGRPGAACRPGALAVDLQQLIPIASEQRRRHVHPPAPACELPALDSQRTHAAALQASCAGADGEPCASARTHQPPASLPPPPLPLARSPTCRLHRPSARCCAAAPRAACSGTCWPAPSARCWCAGCRAWRAWA